MIDKQLLAILVCPENRTPLQLADDELVEKLNRAIAAGQVQNRVGEPVSEPVEGGLVREDKTLVYPIREGIPVLIVDEAIPLDEIR